MKFRSLAVAAAALSLAASPAIAQSTDRAPAPVTAETQLGDEADGSAIILAILAAAAIIAGIIIAAGGSDDDPLSR